MIADDLKEPSYQCVTFLHAKQAALIDEGLEQTGLHVVTVEASSMLSHDELLATLGRAFAFPDYYGHNYNALDECLRDLSWLPAPGYVLRVADAERLWHEAPQVGGALVNSWLFCAMEWAAQDTPVPFHLLFLW